MKPLYVGTKNKDKLREIEAILASLPLELRPLPGGLPDVVEDGGSLEANARLKALGYARAVGAPVLADDTGLFVDALGGAPGVDAAHYAGPKATYADNRTKLLRELAGVPEPRRTARFRCVIAVARPDAVAATFEGSVEGRILEAPRGPGQFGYDPLFFVPEVGRSLAEIEGPEKNRLSHRARALASALPRLLDLI